MTYESNHERFNRVLDEEIARCQLIGTSLAQAIDYDKMVAIQAVAVERRFAKASEEVMEARAEVIKAEAEVARMRDLLNTQARQLLTRAAERSLNQKRNREYAE